jgi:ribosomal protein S18 acetylase RimI-like enzyme
VRLARPEDLDYVRDLSKRAFEPYGAYDIVLVQWFKSPTTATLIACLDRNAVGFAMLSRPPRNWPFPLASELLAIAVEKNRRRKGIGDLLMRGAVRMAQQLQVEKILLHTAVGNLPAQRLFNKHGFSPSHVKEGFYPRGQEALMMIREM